MLEALFIIIPLLILSRLYFIPSYLSLVLLLLGAVLPHTLFRGIFFIALLISSVNYFHLKIFNRSISIKSCGLLLHVNHLKDSIQLPLRYFLILPVLLVYVVVIPIHDIPITPLLLLSIALLPLFFLNLLKNQARVKGDHTFIPENEKMSYRNKSYPLEKVTKGFYGEKEFSLPNKDAHVVTIFLESFRGKNVGALGASKGVTPNFDKLCNEGILFTNFHSNATQTFKALFHVLYGLPAYFGSEFQMNSSTAGNINLSGLPDLFRKKGYEPVFIQGGSNKYDYQGNFLKNQGYNRIYDRDDIKKANSSTQGTSWGVHDEYMYDFLLETIKNSSSPLFLNAATITNHHPFRVPENYTTEIKSDSEDLMERRFLQTMQYSDQELGKFITALKMLDKPVDLYIMGDHGVDLDDIKTLKQSIKPHVTHVPLLILPIGREKFTPKKITDVASHIDLVPTMMDLYGLKGKNSSIGSSLRRKRKDPHALVFNQIHKPFLFGEVTNDGLRVNGKRAAFQTLENLFYTKSISSKKLKERKHLDFSTEKISHPSIVKHLQTHRDLYSLILNDCMLIHTLNLPFPKTLKRIELNDNLFICDEDLKFLPKELETISLLRCKNLTDKALTYLERYPLKEIALTSKNFSQNSMNTFAKSLPYLECISFDDGVHISSDFFKNIPNATLREIRIKNSILIDDRSLMEMSRQPIEILLLSDSSKLTDDGLQYLCNSKIECLLLENAHLITDVGVNHLQKVPLHTFSISFAKGVTEASIENLNNTTLQGIYCIGCNMQEKIEEKCIEKSSVQVHYFVDESDFLSGLKLKAFERVSKNIFFPS